MNVPLLDLKPQNLALDNQLIEAAARVIRSGMYILGPEVELFEKECARILGCRHALGVSSGTDALLLALMALDIGPGDEVICPSFTFFATAGSIARTGAVPVFCDVDADSFNTTAALIRPHLSPRTRAIIPVHLFGLPADMEEIMSLAEERRVSVVEDAAQAFGAEYKGKKAGTWGRFGTFSFFPSKNLGGFGDAGLLVTDDEALAEKARLLRTHGARPKYYHRIIGGNFRMDPLQAALLSVKLPQLDAYTERRQQNARVYAEAFETVAGERIQLPVVLPGRTHLWNQYTVRVPGSGQRDQMKHRLAEAGVGTEVYYPVPMHDQECFAGLKRGSHDLPVSRQLSRECLSLPIYPEFPGDHRQHVIQTVLSFLHS